MRQSASSSDIAVTNEEHLHEVKLISFEKSRRQNDNDRLLGKEVSAYRGLVGAVLEYVSQTMAHGAAWPAPDRQ